MRTNSRARDATTTTRMRFYRVLWVAAEPLGVEAPALQHVDEGSRDDPRRMG